MDGAGLGQAAEVLRRSEERFRLATEAAGIGAFDWDLRTGVNVWTPELEAMYGLAPGEFGKTQPAWEQLVHEDDRATAIALVDSALETGRPVQGMWRIVWPDGTIHWISGRFQCHLGPEGEPQRLIGMNVDITELIEAQSALRESEERYRTIVELAGDELMVSSDGTRTLGERVVDDAHWQRRRFRAWVVALAAGARRHRLWVLLAAIAFELAFLVPMGLSPTSRYVLGMPGSLLALTAVVTAVLAGWKAGLVAALAGGLIFWGTVAGVGADSHPLITAISTCIWAAAALIAGLLADALSAETRMRRSAAVALARAETLREREAERAANEERGKIARDLHDSVTQSLFAATLKAEALSLVTVDEAPRTATAADDVRRLSSGALAQMRTMLLELRGDPVEEVPLSQLLRNLVEAAESRIGADVALTLDETVALPANVHEAVYRITQEALNNVVKHAKARHAWVRLDGGASGARLVIGDDGCGFDPISVGSGHIGLKSMRERADASDGQLSLRSGPGEGTVVTAEWRTAR